MGKVTCRIKLYNSMVKKLTNAQIVALEKTGEALHTEVVQAQVMPRDTGHLQDDSTFVDFSKSNSGVVSLISQTPYARRLYYHPEYNFSKTENPNAQGKWLEQWIDGEDKEWCKDTFTKFYKQLGGV